MENPKQTSRAINQLKLLLVDDDNFTHEMMELFLRNTEYSLISAFTADDALRIIVSDPPDIVITDAMMPGESGFSLIDKIKARPASTNIPVLLWTMLTQPDGSVMDASGKADIVIGKPLYRSNMLENLDKAKQLIAHQIAIDEDARRTAPLTPR
jgi:response regulator RpfG family c-di-GMP phosphodiesterase